MTTKWQAGGKGGRYATIIWLRETADLQPAIPWISIEQAPASGGTPPQRGFISGASQAQHHPRLGGAAWLFGAAVALFAAPQPQLQAAEYSYGNHARSILQASQYAATWGGRAAHIPSQGAAPFVRGQFVASRAERPEQPAPITFRQQLSSAPVLDSPVVRPLGAAGQPRTDQPAALIFRQPPPSAAPTTHLPRGKFIEAFSQARLDQPQANFTHHPVYPAAPANPELQAPSYSVGTHRGAFHGGGAWIFSGAATIPSQGGVGLLSVTQIFATGQDSAEQVPAVLFKRFFPPAVVGQKPFVPLSVGPQEKLEQPQPSVFGQKPVDSRNTPRARQLVAGLSERVDQPKAVVFGQQPPEAVAGDTPRATLLVAAPQPVLYQPPAFLTRIGTPAAPADLPQKQLWAAPTDRLEQPQAWIAPFYGFPPEVVYVPGRLVVAAPQDQLQQPAPTLFQQFRGDAFERPALRGHLTAFPVDDLAQRGAVVFHQQIPEAAPTAPPPFGQFTVPPQIPPYQASVVGAVNVALFEFVPPVVPDEPGGGAEWIVDEDEWTKPLKKKRKSIKEEEDEIFAEMKLPEGITVGLGSSPAVVEAKLAQVDEPMESVDDDEEEEEELLFLIYYAGL